MKQTAFAGSWYPGNSTRCEAEIQSFLETMESQPLGDVVAGIVPHAGWIYSGSIACRVLAHVAGGAGGMWRPWCCSAVTWGRILLRFSWPRGGEDAFGKYPGR